MSEHMAVAAPVADGLPAWSLRGRELLPIVQGGMGIGISAHRLAGTVAGLGALGTVSSVELRHHHPDLLERAGNCRDQEFLDGLNPTALDHRPVLHRHAARIRAQGRHQKRLFFRGSENLPFGNAIRPVADLMSYLLTGAMPAH